MAHTKRPRTAHQYATGRRGSSQNRLDSPCGDEDDPEQLYQDWLFGTPEAVAEKIHRLTQSTGMTYLNCTFALGQIPHQKVLKSMELFATRVIPHFRDYMPEQSKYPLEIA